MASILSRQRITEGLLGAGSFGVLIAAIAAIDETIRKEVLAVLNGESAHNFAIASASVQQTAHNALATALSFTDMNTPLVFFAAVAVVLFFLMLQH